MNYNEIKPLTANLLAQAELLDTAIDRELDLKPHLRFRRQAVEDLAGYADAIEIYCKRIRETLPPF